MNTLSQELLLGVRFTGEFVTLDPDERRRHLYIVGQTGTGKSTLLLNLIAQDLAAGEGLALLDPHGEHDFGSFEVAGKTFFWKIDTYDAAMEFGSEDPADPTTTRVLTIMLASEYCFLASPCARPFFATAFRAETMRPGISVDKLWDDEPRQIKISNCFN